jgi:hypothetical protein
VFKLPRQQVEGELILGLSLLLLFPAMQDNFLEVRFKTNRVALALKGGVRCASHTRRKLHVVVKAGARLAQGRTSGHPSADGDEMKQPYPRVRCREMGELKAACWRKSSC